MFGYVPRTDRVYNTRHAATFTAIKSKHTCFNYLYITPTIIEWNRLEQDICNTESNTLFIKRLLSFIRPIPSSVFNVHNAKGISLGAILRNKNFVINFKTQQIIYGDVETLLNQQYAVFCTALALLIKD